jgi:metallophosphoesterase superfamily enzyme
MLFAVACNSNPENVETEKTEDSSVTETTNESSEGSSLTEESEEKEESSETHENTEKEESSETDDKKVEEKNEALEMVDFIVSVPEGREPKILQITDPQIIDASQVRTPDRLGGLLPDYWGADKKNERCYNFLEEIITETDPDLILLTGDIIYGEFDDNGSNLIEFIEFMESFNIPWAPIFGNHDNESKMGADWQSEQFENAENCLFIQRKLTGNGNYTVGIEQGGELIRVFFMLDSNGVYNASEESLSNGHTQRDIGFGQDQIKWYTKNAKAIKNESPDTKISFAFHIQLDVFGDAFAKYTTDPSKHIFIDYAENRQEGDFGYIEKHYSGFDADKSIFEGLKKLGVDSIFVGHEHSNSASIVYEGVRLQFGMKCTSYDSLNYVSNSGEIEYTAYSTTTPWVGGTVFELDAAGNIVDPYIYYCENGGAKIDWDNVYKKVENPAYDDVLDAIDFIVDVPEGREPIILHLTDMQIIDSSQQRSAERLGGSDSYQTKYWSPENKDIRCYDFLRDIITNTNPDLILITGDLVYGEFDDNGQNFLELVKFMESFNIPWAPVFGNHDNESYMGVDWQCDQLEAAENCLFLQRELTGNGNYTVGIRQGDELTRVFFMLDSNGCGGAKNTNSHTKTSFGFGQDQIAWYSDFAKAIKEKSPATKLSMAFHVQLAVFEKAFGQYGTNGNTQVDISNAANKTESDFGYIGKPLKNPWGDESLWNGIKALGIDSIFVGHEHANSASITYEGVLLQYGMKCSTYDRNNYFRANGQIYLAYVPDSPSDKPWIGGTVMKLGADGTITDAYIYYYEETKVEAPPSNEIAVSGLQKGTDLTTQSGIEMEGVEFDENINAYKVVGNSQGKVFVNTELLKNKSTFTFTVYVPSTSKVKLGGLGEFSIRTKPNEIEPEGDGGSYIGYIDYNSTPHSPDYKIVFDTWQTFTVDISTFGEKCTEFAFVIAAGNTIYLRDIVIE